MKNKNEQGRIVEAAELRADIPHGSNPHDLDRHTRMFIAVLAKGGDKMWAFQEAMARMGGR